MKGRRYRDRDRYNDMSEEDNEKEEEEEDDDGNEKEMYESRDDRYYRGQNCHYHHHCKKSRSCPKKKAPEPECPSESESSEEECEPEPKCEPKPECEPEPPKCRTKCETYEVFVEELDDLCANLRRSCAKQLPSASAFEREITGMVNDNGKVKKVSQRFTVVASVEPIDTKNRISQIKVTLVPIKDNKELRSNAAMAKVFEVRTNKSGTKFQFKNLPAGIKAFKDQEVPQHYTKDALIAIETALLSFAKRV